MVVVNLFAFRATKPGALFATDIDIVGERNDETIELHSREAAITLAGWGADKRAANRAAEVIELVSSPMCVGTTKSGAPRHPPYVANSTPLTPYR